MDPHMLKLYKQMILRRRRHRMTKREYEDDHNYDIETNECEYEKR